MGLLNPILFVWNVFRFPNVICFEFGLHCPASKRLTRILKESIRYNKFEFTKNILADYFFVYWKKVKTEIDLWAPRSARASFILLFWLPSSLIGLFFRIRRWLVHCLSEHYKSWLTQPISMYFRFVSYSIWSIRLAMVKLQKMKWTKS